MEATVSGTYQLGVTCPRCCQPLELVNTAAMDCGLRMTAILKCHTPRCSAGWQLVAELITTGKPPSLHSAGG